MEARKASMKDVGSVVLRGGRRRTFELLQPDYVDAQATHKPQKSKKHFQLGSLSASTAEDDNPIAPSAIASVAQNNPRPREMRGYVCMYVQSCRPVHQCVCLLVEMQHSGVRLKWWPYPIVRMMAEDEHGPGKRKEHMNRSFCWAGKGLPRINRPLAGWLPLVSPRKEADGGTIPVSYMGIVLRTSMAEF